MSRIPTRDEILEWITEHPTKTSKRDIAKAFGIKGAGRIELKRVLRGLEADGHLEKRRKTYRDPDKLPPVAVLQVSGTDTDGDVLAQPVEWSGDGARPIVLMIQRDGDPALGEGDRVLVRVTEVAGEDHSHEGRLIRRIGVNPKRVLGVYRETSEGGRIQPIDKGGDREWLVGPKDTGGAKDGELVEAEQSGPKGRMGLPRARILARLGDPSAPKAVSLIAIHQHDIPDDFPDDVITEAESFEAAGLGDRRDLRDMPLVTIDPSDARDHDDACFAEADTAKDNPGGHVIWVAIADVAHYVRPGSLLDKEALNRGNSTYFPDRVVPMLPDVLSGDLCSLHEGVDRACMAVRMRINAAGEKIDHEFIRGLMRSPASLHYEEVQAAMDGDANPRCAELLEPVIKPLYAAYAALVTARKIRQPLDLDLPERQIVLGDDGRVHSVAFKERLDAHRLIEEFMVLANVAAAEALEAKKSPLLYRVHEEPSPEKIDALREVAKASGLGLAKGQVVHTRHLNRLLAQAAETDQAELISISTLRSMTQAYYTPKHFGHFGLALTSYAHFTSPIRRYADLVVHRALVSAYGWGDDGLTGAAVDRLEPTAKHISDTERRSMTAERDTTDRYLASYLSERVGSEMTGRIAGVARFGAFVKLDETGADGLIPIREIGREYFHFDADTQSLMGSDTGLRIEMGLPVTVRLAEAVPVTGGLIFELVDIAGKTLPAPPKRGKSKGKRKGGKARKVTRRRKS